MAAPTTTDRGLTLRMPIRYGERMAYTEIPTWRLRENLRRTATERIEGRRNFEQHVGRTSTKPLTKVDLDPREVLQLLDALDAAEAEVARLSKQEG